MNVAAILPITGARPKVPANVSELVKEVCVVKVAGSLNCPSARAVAVISPAIAVCELSAAAARLKVADTLMVSPTAIEPDDGENEK